MPRRYALEYLKGNWNRLREFEEAFSGVDMDEMRNAVQPLLVAEGALKGVDVARGASLVCAGEKNTHAGSERRNKHPESRRLLFA